MSVKFEEFTEETMKKLPDPGLLLVSAKRKDKPNVMTIGWGLVGIMWRKPTFQVLVRPSRYTHRLIEERGEFTINVPAESMEKVVAYCGEVSGRDVDKFKKCRLTAVDGKKVKVPIIEECKIHYECKVVHKLRINPSLVPAPTKKRFYAKGNFHTMYFGKIQAVY